MARNGFTKSFTAEGAIAAYSIAKVGATDTGVLQAAAATDTVIGVTTEVDAVAGERVDVVCEGAAFVRLGGTVTRGQRIASNAQGLGVAAAPAAGVNNGIVGAAVTSGVSGDIVQVILSPGSVQG